MGSWCQVHYQLVRFCAILSAIRFICQNSYDSSPPPLLCVFNESVTLLLLVSINQPKPWFQTNWCRDAVVCGKIKSNIGVRNKGIFLHKWHTYNREEFTSEITFTFTKVTEKDVLLHGELWLLPQVYLLCIFFIFWPSSVSLWAIYLLCNILARALSGFCIFVLECLLPPVIDWLCRLNDQKSFYNYRTTPSLQARVKLFVAARNGHFIMLP